MKPHPSSDRSSDFGLIAWLEKTRVALPLKGIECNFEVTGAVVGVELDQIYHQNTDRPLDCTYTFPLPAGAAVFRCELHANGRVIRAKVEERENARRIFLEQKTAGHRAALVEMERKNLFTLSLGNMQPGDVLVVRLAWFQVLDRTGAGMRLLVPTCPGVRYIPGKPLLRSPSGQGTASDTDQVPDASRITPPRIDALHPDAAYVSIAGTLSSSEVAAGTLSSSSHPVCLREAEGRIKVELFGRDAVPDRDFTLEWQEPKANELAPRSWQWTERGETFVLVQLRAPENVKVSEGLAQDFYFLVDRSGSMEGAKWQRTCEALHAFVGLLGPADRVWITLFESGYRDFAEAPMLASRVMADQGFQRLSLLGTGGGTELMPAATHVLRQIASHSAGRRTTVVLITDGEVGNDQAIVSAFASAPHVRVHTFGIDTTVNDAFLKALALQQHGGCWLQTPNDDIAGTIAALGDRLRRPVLTELSVLGGWEASRAMWPDLHAREVVNLALRGDATNALEISGRLPDGSDHHFAVPLGTTGSAAVKLLWMNERIEMLGASGRRHEAIALARQHNLICEGAAFIAWDEAERTQVAQATIVQPALQPVMVSHAQYAAFSPPQGMACASDLDSAAEFGGFDALERIVGDRAEGSATSPRRAPASGVIQARTAAVRKFLHAEKAPESAVAALVAWVLADETFDRLHVLEKVIEFVMEFRRHAANATIRAAVDRGLRQALAGSPHALLEWADTTRRSLPLLEELVPGMSRRGTPGNVIDPLIAWALEPGDTVQGRLEKLRAFAHSLDQIPFSADSTARHWRAFLDESFARPSPIWDAAQAWLADAETASPAKTN